MKILYEEMRPQEFLDSLNKFPVAYLPLGTLEWHGLHMPLGADRIMQNLARAGFKVVVAHGHGPSTNTFTEQKKAYTEKYGLQVYTLWDLGYKEKDGIMTDHAAANETSLVLALHPELVDMNNLKKDCVPVGSWGEDPRTGASEDRGKILIEKNVELISKNLQEIVKGISFDSRSMDYYDVKSLLGK